MAPGPNTTITTMRMPNVLMKMLDRRASKLKISRTRLVEWVLRDYCTKSDAELKDIVTAPAKELPDEGQLDIFG